MAALSFEQFGKAAEDDAEELYEEFLWLRHQGLNLWWDNSANDTYRC